MLELGRGGVTDVPCRGFRCSGTTTVLGTEWVLENGVKVCTSVPYARKELSGGSHIHI